MCVHTRTLLIAIPWAILEFLKQEELRGELLFILHSLVWTVERPFERQRWESYICVPNFLTLYEILTPSSQDILNRPAKFF